MIALRFTLDQKCRELRRELDMRRRVYAREVTKGKMSPNEAREKLAIMEEILEDYQNQQAPRFPES